MPTVSQSPEQTIDGSQLKITFGIVYDNGVTSDDIISITATFKDSAGNILSTQDVTGFNVVYLSMIKDQSIRSEISYSTGTEEFSGIAHIATTRFATYKLSQLIKDNILHRVKRRTEVISEMPSLINDAEFIHSQGRRADFDQAMNDINRIIDSLNHC